MTAPLPYAALLRRELERYVAALGRRRWVPPDVHVGVPGGVRVTVAGVGLAGRDVGWRADLLERAIDGVELVPRAWITRCGTLEPTDDDLAWCAGARLAFARHGLELPAFHVLTRYGWRDLLGAEVVTFHRVRRR